MDIAAVKARKQAPTITVPIILDADARSAVIDAEDAYAQAVSRDKVTGESRAAAALSALEDARSAAREHVAEFRFRSIGRKAYEDMVDAHPATPAQQAKFTEAQIAEGIAATATRSLAYNPDTFPPALVAASCVTPAMSPSDALEMWESNDWSAGELTDLLIAAQSINSAHRRVELGKG